MSKDIKITELTDKMTLKETDQASIVEEQLKKQRERLNKNFEIERSWMVKAHDNELARKDNHI